MKATLNGALRERVGKTALRPVRKENLVPAVIYGHHVDSMPIKIDSIELEKFLKSHGEGTNLDLVVDGKTHNVLIKEIQWNRLKGKVLHVDFQELQAGETVKVNVACKILNKEAVEDSRTVLTEVLHELEVIILPKDLIDHVEIDVSNLKVGDNIKVCDLSIYGDDRYEFVNDADDVIVMLAEAKAFSESEVEEEATDEPKFDELSEL